MPRRGYSIGRGKREGLILMLVGTSKRKLKPIKIREFAQIAELTSLEISQTRWDLSKWEMEWNKLAEDNFCNSDLKRLGDSLINVKKMNMGNKL